MLYAGLDLSRQRLDVHLLDEDGRTVEVTAVRPDGDALRSLVARMDRYGQPVSAAIESMNGARFVHDTLELAGWDVEIADALKVKGLAPLAAKTDRIDAWVLAELGRRELVPAIWLPDPDDPGRARAGTVPAPPRPPPDGAQEPDPRDPDRLRPPGPGVGPVRGRRPGAARRSRDPRALGDHARDAASGSSTTSTPRSTPASGSCGRWAPTIPTSSCCAPCPASAGCWATRSPPRSATSAGSPARRSSPGTPGCARSSASRAAGTTVDRSRRTGPSTCAGRSSRRRPTPPGSPVYQERYERNKARLGRQRGSQGRPGRHRPRAGHRDLAHAHQARAVRSRQVPRDRSGRLTTLD